jgi:small-conductance mechanosensitive channel
MICGAVSPAQESKPQPLKAPAQQDVKTVPIALPPIQLDGAAVLHHLSRVISWYRHATTGIQGVGLSSDAVYQDSTQALGAQAVQLAFQSAEAEALLMTAQQKTGGADHGSGETQQEQNLAQLQARTSSQIEQMQAQIEDLDGQMARAPAVRRGSLAAQRENLQDQLGLKKALLDAIQKMAAFVGTNDESFGGLEGGINQLARSVPEVLGSAANPIKASGAPTPSIPSLATSGGLISEAMALYDHLNTERQIKEVIKEIDATREMAEKARTPLRDALQATIQRSQELAGQPPATDPGQAQGERQAFQELTERFKHISGALLPLSQEIVVLNDSKTNVGEWLNSIAHASRHVLRSVLTRALGIALALVVILVLSEIWRRITFRYVSEPRRRRQFLVLRRVVIGFLMAVVLTLGLVTQFSSLATFAGFITAGIAIGLQALLLSVAAYFFIIGRYGIRIGDRISIAGITGDVVNIGLVRMYLMELAGTGLDLYPTGRIAVFSNAVLFQAGTPLFKQIPGSDYAWHELVVMIVLDGNHKAAQEKVLGCVNKVFSRYREEIERQHGAIERRVDIQVQVPRPEARLEFADAGLALLVRFPVQLRKASDTDEEMTRSLLELIEADLTLKAAISGSPKIRSAMKG